MEFIPRFKSSDKNRELWWLLFSGKEEFIACDSSGLPFLTIDPETAERDSLYLGVLEGRDCYSVSFKEQADLPSGAQWVRFGDAFRTFSPEIQYPVSRGKMLQEWKRTTRYCGSCGAPTESSDVEHVKKCPGCGDLWYPRMAPAVIVRITKGDEILLAHNVRFPEGLYSHIAGFVDPGETLEQTIRREVAEEVGLKVKNIRYFSSQCWPMPHSLMLGFTAEAEGDEDPVPDGEEIVDARWFTRDTVPGFPGPGSIAGRMLLDYLSETDSRPEEG